MSWRSCGSQVWTLSLRPAAVQDDLDEVVADEVLVVVGQHIGVDAAGAEDTHLRFTDPHRGRGMYTLGPELADSHSFVINDIRMTFQMGI